MKDDEHEVGIPQRTSNLTDVSEHDQPRNESEACENTKGKRWKGQPKHDAGKNTQTDPDTELLFPVRPNLDGLEGKFWLAEKAHLVFTAVTARGSRGTNRCSIFRHVQITS